MSINKPRAMIIPVIEVICKGSPISRHPNKTKETENGKIAVTINQGRIPNNRKLKLNTKKAAMEKLFINSLNFEET